MADIALVDALARLQLEAQRAGYRVVVTHAPAELTELVHLAGLDETLGLEARRQAEQREEHVGVEKECELPDLPA
jgi:hypothetical protein